MMKRKNKNTMLRNKDEERKIQVGENTTRISDLSHPLISD